MLYSVPQISAICWKSYQAGCKDPGCRPEWETESDLFLSSSIFFYLFSKRKEHKHCKYTEEVSKFEISYQSDWPLKIQVGGQIKAADASRMYGMP